MDRLVASDVHVIKSCSNTLFLFVLYVVPYYDILGTYHVI